MLQKLLVHVGLVIKEEEENSVVKRKGDYLFRSVILLIFKPGKVLEIYYKMKKEINRKVREVKKCAH